MTIHEVTERLDAGPIVSQLEYSIYPEDSVVGIYERSLAYGYTLFEQTMPMLDWIESIPQDEEQSSMFTMKQSIEAGVA